MGEEKGPRIGLGLILMRNHNSVLLGKRKGSHGSGFWSFPGGHLKYGEIIKEGALRELKEETGLTEENITLINEIHIPSTEDFFPEDLHYITLYLRAKYHFGLPRVIEHDKCERWDWFPWNSLPRPLFLPVENLVKQGYNPFRK